MIVRVLVWVIVKTPVCTHAQGIALILVVVQAWEALTAAVPVAQVLVAQVVRIAAEVVKIHVLVVANNRVKENVKNNVRQPVREHVVHRAPVNVIKGVKGRVILDVKAPVNHIVQEHVKLRVLVVMGLVWALVLDMCLCIKF